MIGRAALDFGDCFACPLAQKRGCPLLFVGDNFTHTGAENTCRLTG